MASHTKQNKEGRDMIICLIMSDSEYETCDVHIPSRLKKLLEFKDVTRLCFIYEQELKVGNDDLSVDEVFTKRFKKQGVKLFEIVDSWEDKKLKELRDKPATLEDEPDESTLVAFINTENHEGPSIKVDAPEDMLNHINYIFTGSETKLSNGMPCLLATQCFQPPR